LGTPRICLDVGRNLGRHQQAAVTRLGPLADLDQHAGRVLDHVGHGLDDTVPAEVTGSDLQDHVLQVLALQQATGMPPSPEHMRTGRPHSSFR
jgi:hypothetical protein